MSLFPTIIDMQTPTADTDIQIEEEVKDTPKEFRWDFINNEFLLKDGKFIIVEGLDAIKVWVWKALSTPRNRFDIYDENYGNDLETLVGNGYSFELIVSEIKRFITDCLTKNSYITGISNFGVTIDTKNLSLYIVTFSVVTTLGTLDNIEKNIAI